MAQEMKKLHQADASGGLPMLRGVTYIYIYVYNKNRNKTNNNNINKDILLKNAHAGIHVYICIHFHICIHTY